MGIDDIWESITDLFEGMFEGMFDFDMENMIPVIILYVVGLAVMIGTFVYWETGLGIKTSWINMIGTAIVLFPVTYVIANMVGNK